METGEGTNDPRRNPFRIVQGITRAIFGKNAGQSMANPAIETVQPNLPAAEIMPNAHDAHLSTEEAYEAYDVDKDGFNNMMLLIRNMEESRLENEVPEGFLESYSVGIYPFSERYVTLLALRSMGFDIRTIGPIVGGTEMYDNDLHDEVRTAVRPEEFQKMEKILFRARGHSGVGWRHIMNIPSANTAPGTLGHPIIEYGSNFKPVKWHEVLDAAMRSNVYFKHGNIFRPEHFATQQSGVSPWHEQLIEEGVLQRLYMTSHIFHDLVYRHRSMVEKADQTDVQIYGFLKEKGFNPYGPEELVGFAHTMIREILDEHPEWAPAQSGS